jgi:hypothetical protein
MIFEDIITRLKGKHEKLKGPKLGNEHVPYTFNDENRQSDPYTDMFRNATYVPKEKK